LPTIIDDSEAAKGDLSESEEAAYAESREMATAPSLVSDDEEANYTKSKNVIASPLPDAEHHTTPEQASNVTASESEPEHHTTPEQESVTTPSGAELVNHTTPEQERVATPSGPELESIVPSEPDRSTEVTRKDGEPRRKKRSFLGGLFKLGKGKKKTSNDSEPPRTLAIDATTATAAAVATAQVAGEASDVGPSREDENKDIQFAATEAELSETPDDNSDEGFGTEEPETPESDSKITAESLLVGRARSEEQSDDEDAGFDEAQNDSGYYDLVDVDYGDIDLSLRDVSENDQVEDRPVVMEVTGVGLVDRLVEGEGDSSQVAMVPPEDNLSIEPGDLYDAGEVARDQSNAPMAENMDPCILDVLPRDRDDPPLSMRDNDPEVAEDTSRDQLSKKSKKKSILGGFMRFRSRSKDRDQSPSHSRRDSRDQAQFPTDDHQQSVVDAELPSVEPLPSSSVTANAPEIMSDETAKAIVHEEKFDEAVDNDGKDDMPVSEVESHATADDVPIEKEGVVSNDNVDESHEASPSQFLSTGADVRMPSVDSQPVERGLNVEGDNQAGPSSRSGSFFGGIVRRRGRSNERDVIPPDSEIPSGSMRDMSVEDEISAKQQRKSRLFTLRGRSKDRDTLTSGSGTETERKDENESRRARERMPRLFGFSSRSKRQGSETGVSQDIDMFTGIASVEGQAVSQLEEGSIVTPLGAPTDPIELEEVADELSEHQVLDSNDPNLISAFPSSTETQNEAEAMSASMAGKDDLLSPRHGTLDNTGKEGDVDEGALGTVASEVGAAAITTSVLVSGLYEESRVEQDISRETDTSGEAEVTFVASGESKSCAMDDDASASKGDSERPHEESLVSSNDERTEKEGDFVVAEESRYANEEPSTPDETSKVEETNASTESDIAEEREAQEEGSDDAANAEVAPESLSFEHQQAAANASSPDVAERVETKSVSQAETVQSSREVEEEYEEFRVGGLVLKRKKKKSRSAPPPPPAEVETKTELEERFRRRRESSESGRVTQHLEKDKQALKSSKLDSEVESIMARRRELATAGVVSEVPKSKDEAELKASVVDPEVLAAMSRRRQSVDNSIASASYHGSVAEAQDELSHVEDDEATKPTVVDDVKEEQEGGVESPEIADVLPASDENDNESAQLVTSELRALDESDEELDRTSGDKVGVTAVAGVSVVGSLAAAANLKESSEPELIETFTDEYEKGDVHEVADESADFASTQPVLSEVVSDVDEIVLASPPATPDKAGEKLTERHWWPFGNRDTYQELQSDPQSDIELGLEGEYIAAMDEEFEEEVFALPAVEKDSSLLVDDKENQKFLSPAYSAQDAAEQKFDVEKGVTRDLEFAASPVHEEDMAGTKVSWGSSDSYVEPSAVTSYVEPTAADKQIPQVNKKELRFKDWLKSAFPGYRIGLMCALVGLIVLGFAVGFGVNAARSRNDRSLPTPSPATAVPLAPSAAPGSVPTSSPTPGNPLRQPTYNLLCATGLPDCAVLNDSATPQGMAFNWLVYDNPELILMPDDQKVRRYALATIYYALDGGNWTMNEGWLSEANECDWYTTAIASCLNGAFVSLELDNNKLRGVFPYETNLLTTLTTLSVNNPSDDAVISGGFPVVTNLSSLFRIDLTGNSLTGTLPESLFIVATGLLDLRLQDNEMSGPIPPSISSLASLTTLNLAGNRFSSLPSGIFSLSNLRALNLAGNGFSGPLYDMSPLTKLQDLNLGGNSLVGTIPASLGALTQLSNVLDLSNNTLSGPIPTGIGNLRSLVRLFLNANQLTGPIPAALANLTSLKVVRLEQNNLTGTIPSQVCATFNVTQPLSYVDCDQVTNSCFTFCCQASTGSCECVADDPFVCIQR
jgi:hypothetical protein